MDDHPATPPDPLVNLTAALAALKPKPSTLTLETLTSICQFTTCMNNSNTSTSHLTLGSISKACLLNLETVMTG